MPKTSSVRDIAGGGIENAGNEVRFDAMMLAAFLGGAGGVEITKRSVLEAGVGAIVGENLFERELGFAVWIDGSFAMVFGDGDDFGLAVGGGGGRKDEFFYSVARDGVQKIDSAGNVGGVKDAGLADGFGDESFRGEVHNGINFVLRENTFELRAIRQIDLANIAPGGTAGRWPSSRLSMAMTRMPRESKTSAQMLPMYPAAPVTRIFIL